MSYTNLNNPANYQLQAFDQYGFVVLPAGMGGDTNINEPLSGSSTYRTIQATKDSVVNLRAQHGDTLLNKSLMAGQELHGLFDAIEVLSGEVIAYLAGPFSTPQPSVIWFNFDGVYNYANFPDNQFSFGTDFSFGFYMRTWTNERPRQILLMADDFSLEVRGKYFCVVSGGVVTRVFAIIPGIWTYISVNVSGSSLIVYTAAAYTLSNSPTSNVFDNTYTFTIVAPNLSSVQRLRIGSDLNGENLYYGNFAHFSMWNNRNLSLSEVLAIRPLSITLYTTAMKVNMVHHYQFSYWLPFNILNLANDLIGVPPVNGTINGL
jgi:hypothetical protein